MGNPMGRADGILYLRDRLEKLSDRIRTLELPSKTNIAGLYNQVQTQLASIDARVASSVAANSYTRAQVDAKVASPGDISPGNISASGNVSGASGAFPGGVSSVGVYNNQLTTAYRVQYVNSAGPMGYVPSSRRWKRDIAPADVRAEDLAQLQLVSFRYRQAVAELGDAAAVEVGLIAEDVDAIPGLRWLVDYDEDGTPAGIRYERLALALLPLLQHLVPPTTSEATP